MGPDDHGQPRPTQQACPIYTAPEDPMDALQCESCQ